MSQSSRLRALRLYKELRYLARDYPDPNYDFAGRMRGLFEKNKALTDPAEIEKAIHLGEYIKKETLALYSLSKYRHLRRSYPPLNEQDPLKRFPKIEPNTPSPSP